MFRPRVIPSLLLHDGGLVKTTKFRSPVYVGDPINTVRIFNEKEVDELVIYDIDATAEGREPDYGKLSDIVSEAFMPICYGGGITGLNQIEKLFKLGVEKVSLSASLVGRENPVADAVRSFGSQAVVATIDYRRKALGGARHVYIRNGKIDAGIGVRELMKIVVDLGAGEIILNSIDRDGTMKGYDLDFMKEASLLANVPVVALGGAGSMEDVRTVIKDCGASAAAAGSIFVFYGKRKAVLINYPDGETLNSILSGENHAS